MSNPSAAASREAVHCKGPWRSENGERDGAAAPAEHTLMESGNPSAC